MSNDADLVLGICSNLGIRSGVEKERAIPCITYEVAGVS